MQASLRKILAEWPLPVFAVLDGAHYDDLPSLLRQADVPARALFLEYRDNAGLLRSGPHLAPLDGWRLNNLLRIEGIEKAAVFWRVDKPDEPAFYRHLRTLNLVNIPVPTPDPFAPVRRTVMFRHWDPGVLALTLPVLTQAQRTRLFGPAEALAIMAPEGMLQAQRQSDWPIPSRGRLTLDAAQMQALSSAMTARAHRAVATYLRDTAPELTQAMDDARLLVFVSQSDTLARTWGLITEAGFGRFAWLQLATQGRFASSEQARAVLGAGGASPDQQIKLLMQAMARHPAARARHA